eukprot:NODE_1385_length_1559_cov_24.390728_g1247_i0.p1 GENE.NODE_1385_length_1559_cov_24.390728_g1247_i0~~NODE_1385_length_1559_cov_24.390728_g1247_i0.p1  ORF type:complete len:469 (+),score=96.34 NODE_1385_length_1559_cov_24.390728_g1247_i0:120-1526(+)
MRMAFFGFPRFPSLLTTLSITVAWMTVMVDVLVMAHEDSDSRAFNQWFSSLSNSNSKVRVETVQGMGRGLIATVDIQYLERVIAVPLRFVLMRATVLAHLPTAMQADWALMSDASLLSAFILKESSAGSLSPWSAWIKILPKEIKAAIFWEQRHIDALGIDEAKHRLRSERNEYENEYFQVVSILRKHFSSSIISKFYTAKKYHWARLLVDTRAWTMRGKKFFVPGADMVNHAPDLEDYSFDWTRHDGQRSQKFLVNHKLVNKQRRDVTFDSNLDVNKTYAVVLSDRPCRAGQQLYEAYGDPRNAELMDYHGFVPEWNPYECIMLQTPPPRPPTPEKRDLLNRAGAFSRRICMHEGELSEALLAFFVVDSMRPADVEKCRGVSSISQLHSCANKKRNATSAYVLDSVRSWADDNLRAMGSSIEADEGWLASDEAGSREEEQRAAVMYRLVWKKIWRSIRVVAEDRLQL